MNGRIDSGLGQIVIDTDVIATYAGSVAVECFGIIGMAAVSMKDGLVKLLHRDSLKHGIRFFRTGFAMEHRRKIQRISFHGEPDRLPTENGMGGIFPESVRSWII